MFEAIRRRLFKSAVVAEFHRLHGVNLRAVVGARRLDELLDVQFKECHGDQFEAAKAVAEVVRESFGIDILNLRTRAQGGRGTGGVETGAVTGQTAMDDFIKTVYGDGAVRTAVPDVATRLAARLLMRGRIPGRAVEELCGQLCAGPMPYSTEDLAVAIALNFFRKPELSRTLRGAAAKASVQALLWKVEGRIAPALCESFRQALHPIALEYTQATSAYANEAKELADKMFAQDWPFDPDWIGLEKIAYDLDTATGNTEKSDGIHETIDLQFHSGRSVEQCATILLVQHMTNQKELEDLERRSRSRLR
jgi:hypothetical protein